MSFFVTEKETEGLLEIASRELPMPDGTTRSFSGFQLMWKALDFLIVCGRWSRQELTEIAVRMEQADTIFDASGLLPKAHDQPGPVSMFQIKMLQAPRVDPAMIQLITSQGGVRLSLDECLHNTVASLYSTLQERLG
jgi:hypothetical protein